jgi:alanyl-tRNA synthetase
VSSHLGEDRSTIEAPLADADWKAVARVEEAANRVVWEDRPVERHWVTDAEVGRFALRKPPPSERTGTGGRIRIVEIPERDVSACGGTHTRRTGEVGAIKIVRWERVRGNLRFEFVCGRRALEDHAWRTESLAEAARRRTLKDRDLIAHLERAAAERDELRKQLDELNEKLLGAEARERVGDPPRVVKEFFQSRPREALRRFAILTLAAGAPWVALGAAAPDPMVMIGRAKSGSFDLRGLVAGLAERAGGKGGGSPDLIQMAAADASAADAAWRWACDEVAVQLG